MNIEMNERRENSTPNLGFSGSEANPQEVCRLIYDHLVMRKLLELQKAVTRLNALIRQIAS